MKTFVLSEEELTAVIVGCVANDRLAQEKLYKTFFNKMKAMVRSYISCPYKSEEVLNSGFLRAFQKINTFGFKGSFEGWLRRIIFHSVADYIKLSKKKDRELYIEVPASRIPSVKAEDSNLEFNQLLELVEKLPSATKTVFHLSVFEGYTHREIGEMLDISEGTSKWHLSEGKSTLREDIKRMKLNIAM